MASIDGSAVKRFMIYRRLRVDERSLLIALLATDPKVAGYGAHVAAALPSDRHEVWGGYDDEAALVAGMVLSWGVFDAEIDILVVAPQWRRQGLGQQLIQLAIQRATLQDKAQLLLEVRASNALARHLYRRLGFQDQGERPGYYPSLEEGGNRETACLMGYSLDEARIQRH